MRAEYNILEKRKWRSLAEEKDILLEAKDKEIEDLKSQLLKAKEESAEVAQLRVQVSGLEATENSLRGEVASTKEHNVLLEQECDSLKLKVTSLESTIAEKDHELSDLGASSSSLKFQNQSLVNQVHELEISSADLREKLEMYEGSLKQLEEFQDNLMGPLKTRLAEIDADFTRCCMRFQESFHPHLLNVVAGRRWLLTHGMKLLLVKCLNSIEKDAACGNIMDLLRLDGLSGLRTLGYGSLLAMPCLVRLLWIFAGGRVEKMERNLIERLPFLKDVFVSIDDPLSVEALIEPPVEVPLTNCVITRGYLFLIMILSVSVDDYDNHDLADVGSGERSLGRK
ncbi:hypothetical protein Tco_0745967 [Tanacetum coccineum]